MVRRQNTESLDELLEYRHLRYKINDLKNELAKAEYSIVDCEAKKSILEEASEPFKSIATKSNSNRVNKTERTTNEYSETIIVYSKWLGIEHNYNGMFQDINECEVYLNDINPAPSNEGNKVAILCNVNGADDLGRLKNITEEFPYFFDILVCCKEKKYVDEVAELHSDNLCKTVIRVVKPEQNQDSEHGLFADCLTEYDEVLILNTNQDCYLNNAMIRRIAALFHNILDLAYFGADDKWFHIGRIKEKGFSVENIFADNFDKTVTTDGLSVARLCDDRKIVIERVNNEDSGKEDIKMEEKQFEIPEDMEAMKQELLRCRDRIAELEGEQDELKESVQKKKDEMEARSRNIIDKMEIQMSLLKMENTGLKVANAAIKDSMSWRITKPLRDFGALFIK